MHENRLFLAFTPYLSEALAMRREMEPCSDQNLDKALVERQ